MKFTEVEVIEHLVKAYKEAGKPTYPHENLYRGRVCPRGQGRHRLR